METYLPILKPPPGQTFAEVNVISLQETIHEHDPAITHVRTKQGKVWKIFTLLNKKSVPLNHAGDGPQRVNFTSVESFGVLGDPENTATAADTGDTPDETPSPQVTNADGNPINTNGQTFGQHLQAVIDGDATPGTWTPTDGDTTPAAAGHAGRAHAVLSASGAHRWINCPPSALLEADRPDTTNDAADQGTAAHELAEHKLRKALKQRSERPTSPHQDDEMEDLTDAYRDWVLQEYAEAQALTDDAQIFIEQRVDFSQWVEDGFGTSDVTIIGDGTLHVIDLKYGAGIQVDAAGNPQGRLYALGALALFDMLYDIRDVQITIYQPRRHNISSETLTVDELYDWADTVIKPAAALAAKGAGDFAAGEWCGFCKLKNTCRARAEANLQIAQWEFDPPVELTDDELVEAMKLIPAARKWMNDVEKHLSEQAIKHGKHWPGFKIVAGKSNRVFVDPDKVAAAAAAAGYTDVWDRKLIGITAMEKLMGKQTFAEVLDGLVVKPEGKPTLVPESDPRESIASRSAEADFT